ncbi:MAG: DUF3426 domain-containing protein [Arenimonas sp.]
MAADARKFGLPAVTAILALALLLQIAVAERERLAHNAFWRPAVERLCLLASCRLSAWRQPDAFTPVQQAVAADPRQAGVLRVQLGFRNDAAHPQPWPQIEIALTGIEGETVGLRRFAPAEYLNAGQAAEIQPGQTVSVEIALQETSGKAAGFAFDFR